MAQKIPVLVNEINAFLKKNVEKPFEEVLKMAESKSAEAVISALVYILQNIIGKGGYRSALSNFDPLAAKRQPSVLFAGLMKKLAKHPLHLGLGVKEANVEALCDFCFYHAAVDCNADVFFAQNKEGYHIVIGHTDKAYIDLEFDTDCALHEHLMASCIADRYFQYERLGLEHPISDRVLYQTLHAYGRGQSARLHYLNMKHAKKSRVAEDVERASNWYGDAAYKRIQSFVDESGGNHAQVVGRLREFLIGVLPKNYDGYESFSDLLELCTLDSKTQAHLFADLLYVVSHEVPRINPSFQVNLEAIFCEAVYYAAKTKKLRVGYACNGAHVIVGLWSGDKNLGVSFYVSEALHGYLKARQKSLPFAYEEHDANIFCYPENVTRQLKHMRNYLTCLRDGHSVKHPKTQLLKSFSSGLKSYLHQHGQKEYMAKAV